MISDSSPVNKAAILRELGQFSIETCPFPRTPLEGEVLVEIKSIGICGSDVHFFAHGSCGSFKVMGTIILGHESSGIIAAVGSNVTEKTNLKAGDRVSLEPGIPCRRCEKCRKGDYNLCPDIRFFAAPPYNGSLSNFIVHDAHFCF